MLGLVRCLLAISGNALDGNIESLFLLLPMPLLLPPLISSLLLSSFLPL